MSKTGQKQYRTKCSDVYLPTSNSHKIISKPPISVLPGLLVNTEKSPRVGKKRTLHLATLLVKDIISITWAFLLECGILGILTGDPHCINVHC